MSARDEFGDKLEAHRATVRVHCYRMLGRAHDVDDAVQQTMLRAWRAQDSLNDSTRFLPWIYRIATNACIDTMHATPRLLPSSAGPAVPDANVDYAVPDEEPTWLEPMPSAWLSSVIENPEARVSAKESVGLAFVSALQKLSAKERAALLLRDVVGLDANETAEAIDATVSAVNNAVVRARRAIEEEAPVCDGSIDEDLLARYVRAWESDDLDALVALLREDVATTMPPSPMWISGRAENAIFYDRMFHGRPGRIPARIVLTNANGQPALGFYRRESLAAPYTLRALQVLAFRNREVARIDHFLTPKIFPLFDLPPMLMSV